VEVLVQLWCLYLYDILQTKNRYVNILLNIPIISPFILMGLILKTIAPRNYNLYFNNVVIVQKNMKNAMSIHINGKIFV